MRARSTSAKPIEARLTLVNTSGQSITATINLTTQFQDIEIPLNNFKSGEALLLPRPYPGFLPLIFKGGNAATNLSAMEKVELSAAHNLSASEKEPFGLELERIWLIKK